MKKLAVIIIALLLAAVPAYAAGVHVEAVIPVENYGAPGVFELVKDGTVIDRISLDVGETGSFRLVFDSLDSFERLQFLDSRYPKNSYQKGCSKHFVLPLKEAEQMNYRLMTDASYLFELAGTRPMNTRNFEKEIKYIPIIHSDYWKGK